MVCVLREWICTACSLFLQNKSVCQTIFFSQSATLTSAAAARCLLTPVCSHTPCLPRLRRATSSSSTWLAPSAYVKRVETPRLFTRASALHSALPQARLPGSYIRGRRTSLGGPRAPVSFSTWVGPSGPVRTVTEQRATTLSTLAEPLSAGAKFQGRSGARPRQPSEQERREDRGRRRRRRGRWTGRGWPHD